LKNCLFVIFLFLGLQVFADGKLDDVVALYTKGVGGKEAIEKVQSIEIALTIQEPKFTVDAIYHADRKIRMRIDIFSQGKRVYTEAFDGKKAWEMGEEGKAKDSSEQGTAGLRNGIFLPGKLFGLHELPPLGHKLSYEGREEVEGVSYHVLKITLDSGFESYLYINPDNGRIERTRDYKALHVDIDPTKKISETHLSDFRKVDGLVFAFKSIQTDRKTNEVVQTTTVKEIQLNPKIDESIYSKP
jgi:hypothetical protein